MKLSRLAVVLVCFALSCTTAVDQPSTKAAGERPTAVRAQITDVTQKFSKMTITLSVSGARFPAQSPARKIRFTPPEGASAPVGTFYASGDKLWTPSRIEANVPFDVVAGRKYMIGIVEASATNPAQMNLISNEVKYLLPMKLDHATPGVVSPGKGEVRITTANTLGPQGTTIVKIGNQVASVMTWGVPASDFRIRIPENLSRPGEYDVWLEDEGRIVSDTLKIKLLGSSFR